MKIAFTADLHLTSRVEHAERYAALENILDQMAAENIKVLAIAGDLFDASLHTYSDFEAVCSRSNYAKIQFLIIPGNHDVDISSKSIAAQNVHIFNVPQVVPFGPQAPPLLLVPYQKNKTMGEAAGKLAAHLPPEEWVLVGHGDYIDGWREPHLYEDGIYMPLTRRERGELKPGKIILGHIHRAQDTPVFYTGSPCGLDINETGRRRFLVFDSSTDQVQTRQVDSCVLYFNETIAMLPVADEANFVRQQAEEIFEKWNLSEGEKTRVEYRLNVTGWTADKTALKQYIQAQFGNFRYYQNGEPDLSQVNVANDPERSALAEAIAREIASTEFPNSEYDPDRTQILAEAIRLVYGRK